MALSPAADLYHIAIAEPQHALLHHGGHMDPVYNMGAVDPAKSIPGQIILEPVQYFRYHQRAFVIKENFAVIAAGLNADDVFLQYRFGTPAGWN